MIRAVALTAAWLRAASVGAGLVLVPGVALAQADDAPLSAIDWLSQSVAVPVPAGTVIPAPAADEPPVTESAAQPAITVRPLDAPGPDALGLLPASVTGLPADLWSGSGADALTLLVRAGRADSLPALRELTLTLLLAEAAPPADSGAGGAMFLARVDRLLDLGAIEAAQALLELSGREDPEVFRRWFDVTLLTGTEDRACRHMESRPALAPTYPARIFCLARLGDWPAAALTLGTARALDAVTAEEEALLARFLDPELFEGADPLPPPSRPSPLVFRLREAVGEPLSTAPLPRAFAQADLRPTVAWRSRMEAAERLARTGSVEGNVLFGLYAMDVPAASGGIWDRAAAVQAFEAALAGGDRAAVAAALPPVWDAMRTIRAEVAFAAHYGARIAAAGVGGELAFTIALLSPGYEAAAAVPDRPGDDRSALLLAVAAGDTAGLPARDGTEGAVIAAFTPGAAPAPALAAMLDEGRLGEALLRAIAAMDEAASGDPQDMTEGLALLRRVGLEDLARRVALQYLLLERAG